jgi:hypothetical protein
MTEQFDERAKAEAERLRALADQSARTDDAWAEFQAPTVQPEMPGDPERRIRWSVLLPALAAAAALVLAVVLVVRNGTDDDLHTVVTEPSSTAPVTTVAPTTAPTTVPPTTASPTTTALSTSTTVPSLAAGFVPYCRESSSTPATGGDPTPDDPSVATLGPIGATPSLHITLPMGRATTGADLADPSVGTRKIPGGVLLSIGPSSMGGFTASILAAVNDDGTVRWVRCFDREQGFYVAPTSSSPRVVLVGFRSADLDFIDWQTFMLADGTPGASLMEYATKDGVSPGRSLQGSVAASNDSAVVLAPVLSATYEATDVLLRIDLPMLGMTSIPVPAAVVGQPVSNWPFALGVNGEMLFTAGEQRVVTQVFHNGAWVHAAGYKTLVNAARPPSGEWAYSSNSGGRLPLVGIDAYGTQLWIRPDIVHTGNEGSITVTVGDTVLAASCRSWDVNKGCADPMLAAVDVRTGEDRWQLPGWAQIGPSGNGVALVALGSPTADGTGSIQGPWQMIDVATGKQLDGQQWDSAVHSFGTGCCGESEYRHTSADGGVVVAVNGVDVNVWFPKGLSTPTIDVVLP